MMTEEEAAAIVDPIIATLRAMGTEHVMGLTHLVCGPKVYFALQVENTRRYPFRLPKPLALVVDRRMEDTAWQLLSREPKVP